MCWKNKNFSFCFLQVNDSSKYSNNALPKIYCRNFATFEMLSEQYRSKFSGFQY